MTRLTTKEMMDATLQQRKLCEASRTVDVLGQVAELHEKVKVFEAVVWFPKLQALVIGTNTRGMSGICRDIKIMTCCCAGRCLIQLERGDNRLTLITADDEAPWRRDMAHVAPGMGPMGIQSVEADFIEALKMLYEVTRWGSEISLVDDDGVSIG